MKTKLIAFILTAASVAAFQPGEPMRHFGPMFPTPHPLAPVGPAPLPLPPFPTPLPVGGMVTPTPTGGQLLLPPPAYKPTPTPVYVYRPTPTPTPPLVALPPGFVKYPGGYYGLPYVPTPTPTPPPHY